MRSYQFISDLPWGPIDLFWYKCSEYCRESASNSVQTSDDTYPMIYPRNISLSPIINPPMTMEPMHPQCILLKLLGRFMAIPTISTKKTTNFLKAMKAARGMIVTQQEDKILIVHIMKAQGMMYTSSFHQIKVFLFIFQFMKIITNLWIINT